MACCRHCCLILKFASAAAFATTHSGRGATRTRTRTRKHTHTHTQIERNSPSSFCLTEKYFPTVSTVFQLDTTWRIRSLHIDNNLIGIELNLLCSLLLLDKLRCDKFNMSTIQLAAALRYFIAPCPVPSAPSSPTSSHNELLIRGRHFLRRLRLEERS